jgi:hypothetical protein
MPARPGRFVQAVSMINQQCFESVILRDSPMDAQCEGSLSERDVVRRNSHW